MLKNPQQVPIGEQFVDSRQLALKGLNTLSDAADLTDQDAPDLSNVVFDAGVVQPRQGSLLHMSKPASETGTPVQLIPCLDSKGNQYMLVYYSSFNVYVLDETNGYMAQVNGSIATGGYTFKTQGVCGYQGWNNGSGNDMVYFGNGTDDTARWRMSMSHLSSNITSDTAILPVLDSSLFFSEFHVATTVTSNIITLAGSTPGNPYSATYVPTGTALYYVATGTPIGNLTSNTIYYAIPTGSTNPVSSNNTISLATTLANAATGTVITLSGSIPAGTHTFYWVVPVTITDGTTTAQAQYFMNPSTVVNGVTVYSNQLSLTNAIGTAFGAGATVTPQMEDRAGAVKGKVMTQWQNSLCTANQKGFENTLNVSCAGLPEDFTAGTEIGLGGSQGVIDGDNGILRLNNFGIFLVILKANNTYRFNFNPNAQLNAQQSQLTPIIAGQGFGPLSSTVVVQALNSLYYISGTSGCIQLSPLATGFSSSTALNVLSYQINNYILQTLQFTNDSRSAYANQKIIWTTGYQGTQVNNLCLVYDLIRQAWTKFDSRNMKDIVTYKNNFYSLSSINGNVYQELVQGVYNDANNTYNPYFYTPRKDFGKASMPKVADALYIEGYIASATTLYADVLYNEKGVQLKVTYEINTAQPNILFTPIRSEAMSQIPQHLASLAETDNQYVGQLGTFRCYLSIPNSLMFYNIQIKFYSSQQNSVWGVVKWGINPTVEPVVPENMRINPIG